MIMYKKALIGLVLMAFTVNQGYSGELDRSVKPEPGPAPSIEMGDYESFELDNGLEVFVVENDRLPRVIFNLVLDTGPIEEGDKKGHRRVTGDLLQTGTENRSRNEINEEIDFLGANLSTSGDGFYGTTLSRNTEDFLDIAADVVLNPSFPEEEFERIISQEQSNISAEKGEPSSIASKIRSRVFFEGHPYEESATTQTIENVTLEDCKNYYEEYFNPEMGYLSVVGDVTKEEIKPLIEESFEEWEEKATEKQDFEKPEKPDSRELAIHDRPHATQTVLNIGHPIELQPGDEDAIDASVMNTLLGGGFFRLNEILREDRAYTYGSYSRLSNDQEVGHFMVSADVTPEATDSSAYLIFREMERLRNEPVGEEELERVKNYRTGNFAISLEDPQTIARFALNIARYDLPEDYYEDYLKNIEDITKEDIQEVANEYLKPDNSHVVAVGEKDEFKESLVELNDIENVRYFDEEGYETEAPQDFDIAEDLTAEDVIENYIEARGGEKLELIDNVSTFTSATVQGTPMQIEEHKEEPYKHFNEVKVGPNVMNKQVLNNDEGYAQGQGGARQPLEGDELEEARIESHIIPEMHYEKHGVETELTGIQEVNGDPAYVIEVTYPTGSAKTFYYDRESHLKVRQTEVVESPQGEMTVSVDYLEYEEIEGVEESGFLGFIGGGEVEGIKFPVRMEQSLGPQRFEVSIDERNFNHDIDASKFDVNEE